MTERQVSGRPITRRPSIDAERSPRDWLLAFVASVPVALAAQVAQLVQIRDDVPPDLVDELVTDGLLEAAPRVHHHREAYRVTLAGLRALGSNLPVPVLELRRYWQDVGAGWLSVEARRGVFGEEVERVFTRREMRAVDRELAARGPQVGSGWSETARAKAQDASFAVWPTVGEEPGRGAGHYPDLTLVLPQGRVAMELVLEVPGERWISAVADAYARKPHLATTVLIVPGPALGVPLRAIIERCGLSRRVMIQHALFVLA
jgi:hypothetical protein